MTLKRQAKEDDNVIFEPLETNPSQGNEMADSAGVQKQTCTAARRRRNANVTEPRSRVSAQDLATLEDQSSVPIKPKPSSDVNQGNFKLPWKNLMITVINEMVLNYARSRANQLLTNAPLENLDKQQATVQIVDLDQDLLKEPTHITQAPTIQESLAMISESWKVQTA
ncbi:MAG: hypothetical protein Q9161_006253 [Pseudevernia consocians]